MCVAMSAYHHKSLMRQSVWSLMRDS